MIIKNDVNLLKHMACRNNKSLNLKMLTRQTNKLCDF